jgi:hypothetical protein
MLLSIRPTQDVCVCFMQYHFFFNLVIMAFFVVFSNNSTKNQHIYATIS